MTSIVTFNLSFYVLSRTFLFSQLRMNLEAISLCVPILETYYLFVEGNSIKINNFLPNFEGVEIEVTYWELKDLRNIIKQFIEADTEEKSLELSDHSVIKICEKKLIGSKNNAIVFAWTIRDKHFLCFLKSLTKALPGLVLPNSNQLKLIQLIQVQVKTSKELEDISFDYSALEKFLNNNSFTPISTLSFLFIKTHFELLNLMTLLIKIPFIKLSKYSFFLLYFSFLIF